MSVPTFWRLKRSGVGDDIVEATEFDQDRETKLRVVGIERHESDDAIFAGKEIEEIVGEMSVDVRLSREHHILHQHAVVANGDGAALAFIPDILIGAPSPIGGAESKMARSREIMKLL